MEVFVNSVYMQLFKSKYLSRWVVLFADSFVSAVSTLLIYIVVDLFLDSCHIPALFFVVVSILSFVLSAFILDQLRVNRSVLRHSTIFELMALFIALFLKSFLLFLILIFSSHALGFDMPSLNFFVAEILDFILSLFALVLMRLVIVFVYNRLIQSANLRAKKVLVYGDDNKAISIASFLSRNFNSEYRVMGFITMGKDIKKFRLGGMPIYVVASSSYFKKIIYKNDIFAIVFPDQKEVFEEKNGLLNLAMKEDVKLMLLPLINELPTGEDVKVQLRDIKIEDLLGRDEIKVNMEEISRFLDNKVVMVTGAAGSIGGELSRLLSHFNIRQLILLDNAETPLHNIKLELQDRNSEKLKENPHLFKFLLADVRNRVRINKIFDLYKPQIIFHAAAYKHVPMMEDNPTEAVNVNVIGTKVVADAALRIGSEKMIMVSTDKAVNPTNVMGASKRIAEIYVQSLSKAVIAGKIDGRTMFVTTRFGNVLGSNGSVIPRFREQIQKGGPVTVTHPDIIRYFMTIPEACRLVLEAATMGKGYEIFVFDMGKPVKIADLARNMISLSGFEPDVDIKIEYTGLRPGEKLYEELLNQEELSIPTSNKKIYIAKVREYDYEEIAADVLTLKGFAKEFMVEETIKKMKAIVPEFKSQNSVYQKFDNVNQDQK